MKIIEKKENPLLSRTEVSAEAVFEKATPSKADIKKQIASELKADENLVVVKNIYTDYGSPSAKITAFVYNSKEAMEKTEPKPKKEAKKAGAKPAEGGEKPAAEAPKEEKKAEEPPKKEEKPAEEKKE